MPDHTAPYLPLRYLSVCSGIEAATVAWHPLGWRAIAYSEIEAFPSAVLAHHYPDTPNLGDMTQIHTSEVVRGATVDLLVGGTPCQAFSVAGLRKGLADPRGNLALVFLGLVDRARPRWVVWENVPGVLSSNSGRDFGAFLGGLGQLGYGWAYRVLDARYFGVAQRRRRVFVVGHLGSWQRAAAVLLERDSLQGNPAPSRGQGAHTAGTLMAGSGERGWRAGADEAAGGQLIPLQDVTRAHQDRGQNGHGIGEAGAPMFTICSTNTHGIANCLTAREAKGPDSDVATTLVVATAFDPAQVTSAENRSNPQPGDPCHTLHRHQPPAVAIGFRHWASASDNSPALDNLSPGLRAADNYGQAVSGTFGVRRLTPRECERLQGFPDDYTLIPNRGRPVKDAPRYKALGNSMAVPVMAWIGRRIAQVEAV